jgi:flavin-dependent dehydrogenase
VTDKTFVLPANEVGLTLPAEICVVGGGPAGSVIAGRLAALGYDVVMVEAESFPRPHIGESLPASLIPLLDHLGVREEIESAGFLRSGAAAVRWAGQTRIRPEVAAESGFQVDRGRFDHILLRAAVSAGARLVQPARALAAVRQGPGRWVVPLQRPGGDRREQVEARFLVDASGRQGLLGKRKRRLTPPTIALYGYWSGTGFTSPKTRAEAGPEHWYWGAPLPDGSFNATVFVSPGRFRAGDKLDDLYRALLSRSELLAGCLSGKLKSAVRACAAAAYIDDEPVGDDWLKVGEAALALDPLSSQGVQTAIISGLQGAAAVHTLLSAQANRDVAIQFVRSRLAETSRRHSEIARALYCEQAQHCPNRFWASRVPVTLPLPRRMPLPIGAISNLTDKVVVSCESQFVQIPVLCGDLIQAVKAILPPGSDKPVAFLADVPIAPLVERIAEPQTAREVLALWSETQPPQLAARLLQWAMRNAVIVRADAANVGMREIRNLPLPELLGT